MSKYRCPRCGATHKDAVTSCRLCGMDMTGEHIPANMKEARKASKKKGIGSLTVWAVLAVLIIVVLGVALGLSRSDDPVTQVAGQIPGLTGATADGWEPLEDPEGGFVVQLPGTATQTRIPFDAAVDGEATAWTSAILDETEIVIAYAQVDPVAEGSSEKARLETLADDWAASQGTSVRDLSTSNFRGLEAVDTQLERYDLNGELAPAKAFLFTEGDTLYVVQVHSIYADMPQYVRVLNSLGLT